MACLLQNGPNNGVAAVILWEEGSPSIRHVAVFAWKRTLLVNTK